MKKYRIVLNTGCVAIVFAETALQAIFEFLKDRNWQSFKEQDIKSVKEDLS